MKASHLQETAAGLFLAAAIVSGVNAHSHEDEAARAKGIEQTYIVKGDQQHAGEWAAYAAAEDHHRDIYRDSAIGTLGSAATFAALGAASRRREREDEATTLPTLPTTKS